MRKLKSSQSTMNKQQHFLLICYPSQGNVNPTLQLAKKILLSGARATFATTVYGLRRVKTFPTLDGLSCVSFSDGFDDEDSQTKTNPAGFVSVSRRVGTQNLAKLMRDFSDCGSPVTFLVYTTFFQWAAEVARDMHVPSAFLSLHSATAFAVYHRFFNGLDGLYERDNDIDPSISIKLPGLPLFTSDNLPSFLLPKSPFNSFMIPCIREHIQILEQDPNPCVLVNTFDELEGDSVKPFHNMNVISVGPLIPSAFSDGKDPSDKSLGCGLFQMSEGYLEWLDSKPESSVVYVSFGSLAVIQKKQKDEIIAALTETGRPFLYVFREGEENMTAEIGLIVRWCSQVEVLNHRSVGCFLTHCGWNSTLESLTAGIPMVGCPQFSDQMTNAKMVEEVWGTGVRARTGEDGVVVEREEIKRCVEAVMGGGEKGEEITRNAMKWKALAMESVKEGGSSHTNLKQFLEKVRLYVIK